MLFALRAFLTAEAAVEAFASAALFVDARLETEAKNRTASGVTLAVPTPVTVICLVESAALAGNVEYPR